MKKIIFAIFAVLCMITVSCQTEYPDSMQISGGTVSIDNLPVPQGKFPQPAFVRIENQNNTDFEISFATVPDNLAYQQYIKYVVFGESHIRFLPQPDSIAKVAPTSTSLGYFRYKYSCETAIKDVFEWLTDLYPYDPVYDDHFFFGVSAAGTDEVFSDIKWSERVNSWFN